MDLVKFLESGRSYLKGQRSGLLISMVPPLLGCNKRVLLRRAANTIPVQSHSERSVGRGETFIVWARQDKAVL